MLYCICKLWDIYRYVAYGVAKYNFDFQVLTKPVFDTQTLLQIAYRTVTTTSFKDITVTKGYYGSGY